MTGSDARVKEEQMSAAQSRIVPRERWAEFFEELSRTFHHRSATIELVAQVQGPEVVAYDQPLEVVTAAGDSHEAITIQLGESFSHTIDAPFQVRVQPYAAGPGQIVEIEAVSAPVTRLYLAGDEERSSGRGGIFGAREPLERTFDPSRSAPGPSVASVAGGETAPGHDAPPEVLHQLERGQISGAGGGMSLGGTLTDFGGAGILPGDGGNWGAGPEEVGGSAGAAGGSVAGPAGTGGDAGLSEADSSITFGSSDDMGGVASVGGGSIGEQDLSGRRSYDITDDVYGDLGLDPDALADSQETSASVGQSSSGAGGAYVRGAGATGHGGWSDADVVDGGAGQGVIDQGIDPIEGAPINPANDATDSYVEGDVGAQAERDLDNLEGTRRAPRPKSTDREAGKK
jgi:hypothetical protein